MSHGIASPAPAPAAAPAPVGDDADRYVVSISPDRVYMGDSAVTLTVTVTNQGSDGEAEAAAAPSESGNERRRRAAVRYAASTNAVTLSIPAGDDDGALTPSLAGVQPTPLTKGWSAARKATSGGYVFVFSPAKGTVLEPGQQAQFILTPVSISTVASGPADVIADIELFGYEDTQHVPVTKEKPPLAVASFVAEPMTVGLGRKVKLSWAVSGASEVIVEPNAGTYKTSSAFFAQGSATVLPIQNMGQTTFTAIARTGDQRRSSNPVTVTLAQPVITSFTIGATGPIDATDAAGNWTDVTVTWSVAYATSVMLSDGSKRTPLAAEGSMVLQPGRSLIGSASSVEYTLIAYGYNGPVTATATVLFTPARILYLKFLDRNLTQVDGCAVGATSRELKSQQLPRREPTPARGENGTIVWTYTAYGPNGPVSQQLGAVSSPQVLYFAADPPNPAPGGTVTLTYGTRNADTLVLDPGNISLPCTPSFQELKTHQVTPTQTTDYVLTASSGSASVTSTLTVTVSP